MTLAVEHYKHREFSWLDFDDRVLQEAQDESVPLLQRLRFLGIFSNNQDEFIRVHLANIVRTCNIKAGKKENVGENTGIIQSAQQLLAKVNERLSESQKLFETIYGKILSEMEAKGIHIVNEQQLDESERKFCRNYFSTVVAQRLVPLILKKNTEIPFLKDNSVYLAVKISGTSLCATTVEK